MHINIGIPLPNERDPNASSFSDDEADTSLVVTTDDTQVLSLASSSSPSPSKSGAKSARKKYEKGTMGYYSNIFDEYVAIATETTDPVLRREGLRRIEPTDDVFDHFNREISEVRLCL